MINWFKNKKDRVDFVNGAATPSFSKPIETPPMPETKAPQPEEWIWVEGYKGTNNKMQGYGEFQFELNKEYHAKGDIELCANGFHFSLNLRDVNHYYSWKKQSRYFKVKALVRRQDYKKYRKRYYDNYYWSDEPTDKLVSQKIILTEEITFSEEVFGYVKEQVSSIDSMDKWKRIQAQGYNEYAKSYWREIMCNYYSDPVVELLLNLN